MKVRSITPSSGSKTLWRSLIGFWGLVLTGLLGGAVALQVLGPPAHAYRGAAMANAELPALSAPISPAPTTPPKAEAPPLLEASALYPGGVLAKPDATHPPPMQAYAASFDTADRRPRIALLIAGVGMNATESEGAIANLPAAVSLAITPYAVRLDEQVAGARAHGHEILVSVPMEPQGYPLNDPGNHGLLTGASLAANAQLLEWALTRFTSYVGATGALGELRGERFAAAADQMAPLLDTLAEHGLLYIDPRPNAAMNPALHPKPGTSRSVDVVIDDPKGADAIDRALARLEAIAHDRGSALGLAGRPSPLTVDRITVWATALAGRGISLAPVSTVVQMPQAPPPMIRTSLLP